MKVRAIITVAFAVLVAGVYLWSWRTVSAGGPAQQKRGGSRKPAAPAKPAPKGKDYSHFSHRSEKHAAQKCDACHQIPTANWGKEAGFPEVADYPSHAACVRCHKTEFYRGPRPVICAVCHTKTSPRDEARFAFAKPAPTTEFGTVFPHDRHQDVIAVVRTDRGVESAHAKQTGNAQKYNNCTICHAAETKQIVTAANVEFLPPVGTFRTAPAGHSSCFTCHYQQQKPTAIQCAGCHTLAPQDIARVVVPVRLSLKFTHDREQHVAECTTCHINITREASVRGLKPDVPITACSSCHKTSTDKKIVTLEIEFEARSKDAKFTCVKCHTTTIGGKELPGSHRAVMSQ